MVPFDEAVAALGHAGERDLGEQRVDLDSIIGSVDRETGFDRLFRPTSGEPWKRFEQINTALRRGEAMPPVELYRLGEAHFVIDGHHRVAVARAMGEKDITAHVIEILTTVGADRSLRLEDLPLRSHARVFHDRVPLPTHLRSQLKLSTVEDYGDLAEGVEAWAFRSCQQRGELLNRREAAVAWFEEEYLPAIATLREAGLLDEQHPTESYMRLSCMRYRLQMTHHWGPEVLDRLRLKTGKAS
jgi:hypothetical protein